MRTIECFNINVDRDSVSVLRIMRGSSLLSCINPIIIDADPFLFVHNNTLYLFYEEKRMWTPGVIMMRSSKDGKEWTKPITVLEKSYHMSFPYVFENEGDVYMIPETCANHSICLYKANNDSLKSFEFVTYLLKRENNCENLAYDYSDSLLYKKDGYYYLFTTYNDGWENILELYVSNTLCGPYSIHPNSPICKGMKYGRNGGPLMEAEGKLYRVAQDCLRRYGDNIHLLEISELSPNTYHEHVVIEFFLSPKHSLYREGGHQLCKISFNGHTYVATDYKEYKFFLLTRTVRKIKSGFHWIL